MPHRRDYSPAAYGAEYTRNLRWRYRAGYGEGTYPEPYRGGGSYGRGYEWAEDEPPDIRAPARRPERRREPVPAPSRAGRRWAAPSRRRRTHDRGPGIAPGRRRYGAWYRIDERRRRRGYGAEYAPGPYRERLRRAWRPGTAAREYDRAYPYFGSAAAPEAASGYPPGETLSPDAHPHGWTPDMTFYGDVY